MMPMSCYAIFAAIIEAADYDYLPPLCHFDAEMPMLLPPLR